METRKKMKSGQVIYLPVQRRAFRLAIIALAAILAAPLGPAAQNARRTKRQQITFEQNGFFYGEEQYYVVTPPLIHVYYQPPDEYDNASEKRSKGMKLQTQPNRDTYFHEIFVLISGKWSKKYRAVSKKPDRYLTANSCDSTNALDLPGGPLSGALPHPIKIKEIEDHSNYAVVVYSDTPDQKKWYSLKIALLEREPNGWRMANSIFGGSFVHFCGTETFHIGFSSAQEPLVLLVYSGWSDPEDRDFISIQSFVVKEALSPGQKN